MPILPEERDPRLITLRRGGTLTDEDHYLLAEWAAQCAEHVLHLFEEDSQVIPGRETLWLSSVRGSGAKHGCARPIKPPRRE